MSDKKMVSVPREPTREMLAAAREVNGIFPTWRAMVDAAPTEQHQGEPVAVLYADGHVLTKADCGDVFDICCKVETPLYTRPAQGEPVAYILTPPGCAAALVHAVDLTYRSEHAVPLYTHADPAEVDRLRCEVSKWRGRAGRLTHERDGEHAQLAEMDALLRNLRPAISMVLNALDRDAAEGKAARGEMAAELRAALSASAEPRPVIAWHVGGNGYDRICFEEPTDLPGHPCIQAVNDQSQLTQLLKRYDLRNEDVPPDERVHGIPGTSFQRLNALANEGE